MKDDRLYLIDMLETARRIEARIKRLSHDEFNSDEDVQLASTHLLQMIGEAARCFARIAEDFFGDRLEVDHGHATSNSS
jgi:uncharacterized protein with HEPN domain